MNDNDNDYIDKVLEAMSVMAKDRYGDDLRKTYIETWEDAEELDIYREKADERRPSNYKGMLLRVMTHLRSTGEDVLLALKDDELREWWDKELAKIKHKEAVTAAKEKAMLVLSEEERRLLGMSV